MQRRTLLRGTWLLAGLGPATIGSTPASAATPWVGPLAWRERLLLGLGTTMTLRAAHRSSALADAALGAAVAALRRVEAALSLYRPASELCRLNREGVLHAPGADLLAVLGAAQHVARASRGAFDVTVQPLWQLHADARAQGRLPTAAELAAARRCVDWRQLEVTPEVVRLLRPGMALTLNGIAQGYAADAARQALQAHGVAHALIDAGEHHTLGRNEEGHAWRLGVEDPRDEQRLIAALRCDGRAVATSSDARSTFSADHRHHHVIDPASGRSPPVLASVTVLAPSAMLADALTKVMFIAGPARIPALARQWQVGVLWVDKHGRWRATADVPVG